MKLVSRHDSTLTFQLTRQELESLKALLGFRAHFPRKPRPLSSDTATDPQSLRVQDDFDAALNAHRQELSQTVDQLLGRTSPAPASPGLLHWQLDTTETDLLLQALNEVSVGAWEKLGCPDFEHGERPKLNSENAVCFWTIQVADGFKWALLRAVVPDDDDPEASP